MDLKALLLTVALPLFATGCATDEANGGPAVQANEPVATTTATGTALVSPTEHPLLPIPEPTGPGEVGVRLREYRIEMTTTTVPAGEVTFHVLNSGKTMHTLVIRKSETGEFSSTPQITPGDSALLTMDLAPGEYDYVCMIRDEYDHYSEGMRGTLQVE